MDVEKCHDEVAVEDRTRRELAGEDSTKDTWIHASPFWRTGRELMDPLRGAPEFTAILRRAEARHRQAVISFLTAEGDRILGIPHPV